MSTVAAPRRARFASRASLAGVAAAGAVLVAGAWVAVESHGGRVLDALPDTLRAGAAILALFTVTGYPAARALLPRSMYPHLPLVVLPLGAVCSSLALTFLGGLHVPFTAALAIVLTAGAAGWLAVARRLGPARAEPADLARAGGRWLRLGWPAYIAAALVLLALLPAFRVGMLTVLGENPDAHLVTGAAEVVKAGPPGHVHPDLPVDRVSPFWKSKYPIYYSLAAVSSLSGLDPIAAFPALSAALLVLFAAGVFLFAYYPLRAGPRIALLAMGLTALDRVVLYLVDHPYYNQLWGTFALPFMLVFGFRFLRHPDRRSALLLLLFLAIGVLAYPLMLPFPAVALGVAGFAMWRQRRAAGEPVAWLTALHLPSLRGRRLLWIPALVAGGWIAFLLGAAVVDKSVGAAKVILPGGDLNGWQGDSPVYPFARFFGLFAVPGLSVLAVGALVAAAVVGLRRLERTERIGLGAMAVGALVMACDFKSRLYGDYFYFKVMAFLGPIVLALGVVGAASWRGSRRLAAAGLAALALVLVVGARNELEGVAVQASADTFALRDWPDRLPARASIRMDIPPTGVQLWAAYMLHGLPLSATRPVTNTTYPHVPVSRNADYVLIQAAQRRPRDAAGRPVLENGSFRLYRMRRGVPGHDRSSRTRIQPSKLEGERGGAD